jgi:hypothetical protein
MAIPGFEIFVNGIPRTFRDREDVAFEAALYLKSKHKLDTVTIQETGSGRIWTMPADGSDARRAEPLTLR